MNRTRHSAADGDIEVRAAEARRVVYTPERVVNAGPLFRRQARGATRRSNALPGRGPLTTVRIVKGAPAVLQALLATGIDPPVIRRAAALLGKAATFLTRALPTRALPCRLGAAVRLHLIVHLADAAVLVRLANLTVELDVALASSAADLAALGLSGLGLSGRGVRLSRAAGVVHARGRALHRRTTAMLDGGATAVRGRRSASRTVTAAAFLGDRA